ncbi:uncharacterized protein LOC134755414 [Cydia strobilella]|uniref:uncharacterized protein LOC134755414 n=1 Tax=Cydia strobilella TaxID=1100964 RepID=UPI003003D409
MFVYILCAVKRRSAGNWINMYCTKLSDSQYKCNLCAVVLTLQQGHYGNMRRHYKFKHPYIFYTESENSKTMWKMKRNPKISTAETNKVKVEKGDSRTRLPKSDLPHVTKKRRSAMWKYFIDLEKGFVRCKICNMKLRDRHYVVALHLNRRHPKTFSDLGDFNIMPFRQRSNFLWNFFIDEGNKFVRCLLCDITMRKNMAKHLQTKHPDNFEQAVSLHREQITKYCAPRLAVGRRTWVKKYCTKIADKQYQCNQCKKILKMPNGFYGNMRRHIRIKHSKIYDEESKTTIAKSDTVVEEKIIDLVELDNNSNALGLKDPLADFDLGSPAISETEIAANFLENDNLTNNPYSEIDLGAITDLPTLEPSCQVDNYDKSYFLLVEDGQFKCIECEETVNCPAVDEQEALFTHIRDKHPEEIMTLQATSTENDDEYQVVVLGNIDN